MAASTVAPVPAPPRDTAPGGAVLPGLAPDTALAVRRVSLASALRVGLTVGPAIALGPAIVLAAVIAQALSGISRALRGITPLELRVFGQDVARLDWLALLQLQGVAETTGRFAALGWLTFLGLTLLLTLAGGLLFALAALLAAGTYNVASRATGGLVLELGPEPPTLPDRGRGRGAR